MRVDLQNAILLVLCLVLLLSVFSLSANAASSDPPELPVYQSGVQFGTYGLYLGERTSGDPSSLGSYYAAVQTNADAYVFRVNGSYLYAVSRTMTRVYGGLSSSSSNTLAWPMAVSIPNHPGYYYGPESSSSPSYFTSYNPDIPVYSTLDEGLDAVVSYIENGPSQMGSVLQYSLPPGNAIYIQVPQGASYTLKTRMPESVLGSNHYPGNNQAITLVQSLPSGGSAPTSPLIPWQQDGALSVLGLSRNAIYQGTNASAGYLCIVNPLYYSGTANGPYEFLSNGSIDISVDTQTGFVVYPLDSSLGFTSGLGINVDTSILDYPYTGVVDPDTGEIIWEDSNGGATAPTTGGGNLVSTSETIFDFLRNIGDEISTFLKGPIRAIQVVVSAIRDFLSSFTQLYMWLPSPVYNLITSALMIALTIGVVKIFI